MKTLWVMRHGEASFDANSDHARSLSDFAAVQFLRVSEQLFEEDKKIDAIHCSDAKRTQSTAKAWQKILKLETYEKSKELYLADERKILQYIQEGNIAEEVDHLLLIGHNPGLSQFAYELLENKGFFKVFQTAALLIVNLPIEKWEDIRFNIGQFKKYIKS